MDSKELRELIEIISRSNFSIFELEREGFKLKLVRDSAGASGGTRAAVSAAPATAALPAESPAVDEEIAPDESAPPAAAPEDGLVPIDSPIVGTFYRAPGPDKPPFVETGDRVKKGQVLCIIEAMKLMNEIESEIDAEIVEIVAVNGQPVEFGEALFRLRPV